MSDNAKDEPNRHFLLGTGLKLQDEFIFDENIIIRPIEFSPSLEELAKRSRSQVEYGFLCAFSGAISFELEAHGTNSKDAAARAWNAQWILVLLSIYGGCPVFSPFQTWASIQTSSETKIVASNCVGANLVNKHSRPFSKAELADCAQKFATFNRLTEDRGFQHAAAIAATNFIEPRKTTRIAAIWSGIEALLGMDKELTFKISLAVAKLLGNNRQDRAELLALTKKLYDMRSKCVHGSGLNDEKQDACLNGSLELLRKLLLHFIDRGKMITKSEMDELFVS